jgi:hypothetical protein
MVMKMKETSFLGVTLQNKGAVSEKKNGKNR